MRHPLGFSALLCAALAIAAAGRTFAADYPTRPIRLSVTFAPGGGADINARIVAQKASEILGQPIIIENRPGAGGNLEPPILAAATPDGYTLLQVTITHAIAAALFKDLKYDILRNFVPVVGTGSTSYILCVNNDVPVDDTKGLIAYAKSHRLLSGTSGVNGPTDLATKLFANSAGIPIEDIPYTGASPAVTDLIGGRIQMSFVAIPTALPLVTARQVKALAVTGLQRSTLAPNLPTIDASGVPGYHASTWFGILAPIGTPNTVLDTLHDAFAQALHDPQTQEKLSKQGFEIEETSRQQFAEFLKAEVGRWSEIINKNSLQGK
jgi:tripartite-type tricarboxylate transporter receptor subunit TctC